MSPAAAEDLAATLRDMRDVLGRTILLIEHNVPLVLDVSDELYVMDAGRVIANGEPVEVVTRPEVVTAYLGVAPNREEARV
jgi:branched-chain amino acid transport system ATP-binding protein